METLKVTLYNWSELNEAAKRRVYESGRYDFPGCGSSEWENTLEAFCSAFDVACYGWHVNNYTYHYGSVTAGRWSDCPAPTSDKAPRWIAKTLWNDYRQHIYTGKYYSRSYWTGGKYVVKSRKSKIQIVSDCPLTGFCGDHDIMRPIINCIDGRALYDSPDELFSDCFDAFFRAWRNDLDHQTTFEYFDDMMQANVTDSIFFENGAVCEWAA